MGVGIENILLNEPFLVMSHFIIGFLFILIVQNIFFYRLYRQKEYLWYFLYAFFLMADHIFFNYTVRHVILTDGKVLFFYWLHPLLSWIYNLFYALFVIKFIEWEAHQPKRYKIAKNTISVLFLGMVLLTFFDIFFHSQFLKLGYLFILIPVLLIMTIYVWSYIYKHPDNIRKTVFAGSIIYLIFSLCALFVSLFLTRNLIVVWSFFYFGIIIENIFFSLALIQKRKQILHQRNEYQHTILMNLKENQKLKETLNQKLKNEINHQNMVISKLNKMAENKKLKHIQATFEREIAELKVRSLHNQMNPHFIFNALNSIKNYIIENEKTQAVYYLNKFALFIRKVLDITSRNAISLQEEIETLKVYTEIENIRFQNQVVITFNIENDADMSQVSIPPLTLQPVVENAFRHGLPLKKGIKKLEVHVFSDQNMIWVKISDNGIGRVQSQIYKAKKIISSSSKGILLIKENLDLFFKYHSVKYQFFIDDLFHPDGTPKGTEVVFGFPTSIPVS